MTAEERDRANQRIADAIGAVTPAGQMQARMLADELFAYARCRLLRVDERDERGPIRLTRLERHLLKQNETAMIVDLMRGDFPFADRELFTILTELWWRAFEEAAC